MPRFHALPLFVLPLFACNAGDTATPGDQSVPGKADQLSGASDCEAEVLAFVEEEIARNLSQPNGDKVFEVMGRNTFAQNIYDQTNNSNTNNVIARKFQHTYFMHRIDDDFFETNALLSVVAIFDIATESCEVTGGDITAEWDCGIEDGVLCFESTN